jgi:hypothetical protein
MSVNNKAVYLLEPNKTVSEKIKGEVEVSRSKILSGEIKVVDIVTATDLHKYLGKHFPK